MTTFHESKSTLVCPWPQPEPSSLEDTVDSAHDSAALVLLSVTKLYMVNPKNCPTAIVAHILYRAIFTQVGVYPGIKSAACL